MRLPAENHIALRREMPASMFNASQEMVRAMWQDSTLDLPLRELLRLKSAELAHCKL
jgi:hypothetical protein